MIGITTANPDVAMVANVGASAIIVDISQPFINPAKFLHSVESVEGVAELFAELLGFGVQFLRKRLEESEAAERQPLGVEEAAILVIHPETPLEFVRYTPGLTIMYLSVLDPR